MKSKTTKKFWRLFAELPPEVQQRTRIAYTLWRANPNQGSLHFKRVSTRLPMYSARVTLDIRVVGLLKGDTITWFWIGAHDEYDRVVE